MNKLPELKHFSHILLCMADNLQSTSPPRLSEAQKYCEQAYEFALKEGNWRRQCLHMLGRIAVQRGDWGKLEWVIEEMLRLGLRRKGELDEPPLKYLIEGVSESAVDRDIRERFLALADKESRR